MNNATAISISNMEVTIHTHCKSSGDGLDANIMIVICIMKALLLGLCIPNFYRPLVFSRKNHMSGDAKARWLVTLFNKYLSLILVFLKGMKILAI